MSKIGFRSLNSGDRDTLPLHHAYKLNTDPRRRAESEVAIHTLMGKKSRSKILFYHEEIYFFCVWSWEFGGKIIDFTKDSHCNLQWGSLVKSMIFPNFRNPKHKNTIFSVNFFWSGFFCWLGMVTGHIIINPPLKDFWIRKFWQFFFCSYYFKKIWQFFFCFYYSTFCWPKLGSPEVEFLTFCSFLP